MVGGLDSGRFVNADGGFAVTDADLSVRVDRADLAAALLIVRKAVPRSVLHDGYTYQGVWLTVVGDQIRLAAGGPMSTIESAIRFQWRSDPDRHAESDTAGADPERFPAREPMVVPVEVLSRLASALEAGPVMLTFGADRVGIDSGRFRGALRSLDADRQTAPRPRVAESWHVSVAGQDLGDALAHVSLALRSDRVWTSGIEAVSFALSGDDGLRLIATDRTHLASAVCPVLERDGGPAADEPALIPVETVQILAEIVGPRADVAMSVGDGQAEFDIDGTVVRSHVVTGGFPDHRSMTDWEPTRQLVVSRRTLATVVRRVGLMAHDQRRVVWFELDRNDVLARTSNDEIGQASERFPGRVTGARCEIGIGLPVLLAMVGRLADGRVVVEFDRTDKVVSIHSDGRPDFRYYTTLVITGHERWQGIDPTREASLRSLNNGGKRHERDE